MMFYNFQGRHAIASRDIDVCEVIVAEPASVQAIKAQKR